MMQQVMSSGVIARLEEWRAQLRLSHPMFARHLGISRPYWSQLRHGVRQPSKRLIARVLRDRPDLQYWVIEDLKRSDGAKRKEVVA